MEKTLLQRKIKATDDMLQIIESNLGEIYQIVNNLKSSRGLLDISNDCEETHGKMNELNAGASIIEMCTNTVLASMYAGEVMGNTPAEHLQYFFDRQMKVLLGSYRD